MTIRAKAMGLVAGLVCLNAGIAAATTYTVTTLSFAAGFQRTNAFLEDSSRLATAQAASPRLRSFARREIAGRTVVLQTFADWAIATRRQAELDATKIEGLGRILGPQDSEIVVDPHPRPDEMAKLAALEGPAFDEFYLVAQAHALDDLVAIDEDFILNGDDQTLRALAVHDLPRAKSLRAEIRRLR